MVCKGLMLLSRKIRTISTVFSCIDIHILWFQSSTFFRQYTLDTAPSLIVYYLIVRIISPPPSSVWDAYICGIFVYKPLMYYKPTLFRADVREIAHGLIIHTIRYLLIWTESLQRDKCWMRVRTVGSNHAAGNS